MKKSISKVCTYCGNDKFYAGSYEGQTVTVLCSNSCCRHWFSLGVNRFDDLKHVASEEYHQSRQNLASVN